MREYIQTILKIESEVELELANKYKDKILHHYEGTGFVFKDNDTKKAFAKDYTNMVKIKLDNITKENQC